MSLYSFSRTEFSLSEFISWKYPEHTSASTYSNKIIACILTSFPEKLSESEIASKLNISSRWFQRECKKAFGITYNELFRTMRVNAGVYMMTFTKLKYSQIARRLNYYSEINMIKDFNKLLGCPPSKVKEYLSKFNIRHIKLPDVKYLIEI